MQKYLTKNLKPNNAKQQTKKSKFIEYETMQELESAAAQLAETVVNTAKT